MKWFFTKDQKQESAPQSGSAPEDVAALVMALPDPVLVIGRDSIVTHANKMMCDTLELDPAGKPIAVAIRAPALLAAVATALTDGVPAHVEYEVHGASPRTFDAYVARFLPGAVVVQLRDLTREQQIERMRADFVANASHELRTPLASLSGFIETLQGAARNDGAARDRFLGLMQQQALRMKRLIDDLLSLSRIEMNVRSQPSETADATEIVRHVGDVMAVMAKAEGASLVLDLAGELQVKGNRDELIQVVQNLVENALKYAGAGKTIEVSARRDGTWVDIAVQDHGPGIAPEHLPRLTERFYRVNVQESRSRGGTGLGLAIVKHILNRHRGRLVVESQVGAGSRFTVKLPAA